jgi:hypothetical protein
VDLRQLIVHRIHHVGGERRRCTERSGCNDLGLCLSLVDWRVQIFGLGLSGGDVHPQDTLCLEHRIMPRRHIRLNHGCGLPVGKVAPL